jgi:Ca-activated chloride channel family protein
MTAWRLLPCAAVAFAAAMVTAGASQPPLELQIVSPAEGSYVSDRLTLEARILPRERRNEITDVTFFADGRLVCRSTAVQLPKCEWDAGAVIKPHLIRVVATTTSGERLVATTRTRDVDFNESVAVRVVQVNASVSDRDGRFVRGLKREQFKLTEDGQPQTIVHFAAEEAPLEIVVAMDVSGSMGIAIDDLKVAVRQFLAKLKPTDQVTLVAFNQEMFVLTQRETSPAARERAVDRLGAWGGTALYDVIVRSLELLSRQPGRRSLVVFSDGEDQASQATLSVVDRAVKASDAALFMVALGRGREQKNLRETLESLSEPSGGRALFADKPSDLGDTFTELLAELTNQYLVGYESTNQKKDGAWRKLEVEVPGTRHRVRARQGYFGPTP